MASIGHAASLKRAHPLAWTPMPCGKQATQDGTRQTRCSTTRWTRSICFQSGEGRKKSGARRGANISSRSWRGEGKRRMRNIYIVLTRWMKPLEAASRSILQRKGAAAARQSTRCHSHHVSSPHTPYTHHARIPLQAHEAENLIGANNLSDDDAAHVRTSNHIACMYMHALAF